MHVNVIIILQIFNCSIFHLENVIYKPEFEKMLIISSHRRLDFTLECTNKVMK